MTILGILGNNEKKADKPPGLVLPMVDSLRETVKDIRGNIISSMAGDLAGNVVKYAVRDRMERRGIINRPGGLLRGNK